MYDNWLFFPPFVFRINKKRKTEKENELAKPGLNNFFSDPFDFNRQKLSKG